MTVEATVVLQTFVGIVLMAAALAKILTRTSVAAFLEAAGLGTGIARVGSAALAPLEIITGSCLLIGFSIVPASGVACGLAATFCVVLIAAYRQQVAIGCRCFGSLDSDHLSVFEVARALSLLLATVALFTSGWINRSLSGIVGNVIRFPTAVEVGCLVGLAFVAVFALLGQVAMFESRRPLAIAASRSGASRLGVKSMEVEHR